MADVARNLHGEFWQAPFPQPVQHSESDDVTESAEPPACARCGTEFMSDSRYCYACGTKRPPTGVVARGMLASLFDHVHAAVQVCAKAVSRTVSALPTFSSLISLSAITRQADLTPASVVAFSLGIVCCLVAVFLSFSATREPGTMLLASHLQRIEWLLGGTAAFVAGILLKGRSRNH